jgi:hypothetical protein
MKTNQNIRRILTLIGILGLAGCHSEPKTFLAELPDYSLGVPLPMLPFEPKTYACPKVTQPIVVDGSLDEAAWQLADWTDTYVDIEGSLQPLPNQLTRSKMCWDDTHLYIAAELQESDIWATLTERDAIIFYDNDFEVFLDPDGDNHYYYELEINALNTVWDLLLVKPYREGGPALHDWNIAGLQTAVSLQGTLNDPSDTDQSWRVEIAIPFKALKEGPSVRCPPKVGDRWKVNFSRVQWDLEKAPQSESGYTKRLNPQTGEPLPEHNWVWSPQGLISMHYPERWGIVEFCAADKLPVERPEITDEDRVGEALMQAYYQLRNRQDQGLKLQLEEQGLPSGWSAMQFEASGYAFTVQTRKSKVVFSVNHQGLLRRERMP